MNKVYRLVWNRALGVLQAVAELAHSPRGIASASGGRDRRPTRNRLAQACATALLMCLAAGPAVATTYTVTSPTDTGDTTAAGTLSWALAQAVDGDTIEITPASISGTGTLPAVNGTIHLVASGDLSLDAAVAGGTLAWSSTGTLTVLGSAPAVEWSVQSGDLVLGTSDTSVASTGNRGGDGAVGGPGASGGAGQTGGDAAVVSTGAGLTLSGSSALIGGAGGTGGQGGSATTTSGGAGGAGGVGGEGVSGSGFLLANAGTVTGGAGGAGGTGGMGGSTTTCDPLMGCITMPLPGGSGGNGGAGGAGVIGESFTLVNTGTVTGGNGGRAGSGMYGSGTAGVGGAGVVALGDASVTNAGLIRGGLADDGYGAQANAVEFSGGGNTLELQAGYQFVGNVVSTSDATNGGDTLALGGDVDGTFDLTQLLSTMPTSYGGAVGYFGFAQYDKIGASTWTLTGTGGVQQGWNLLAGTLMVGDDSATASVAGAMTSTDGGDGVTASESTALGVGSGSSVGGGMGAPGAYANSGVAGAGSAGGAGIAGVGFELTNDGGVTGGDGGSGGGGGGAGVDRHADFAGDGGAGGDAITGAGFDLTNDGDITGGAGGYGGDVLAIGAYGGTGGMGGAGVQADRGAVSNNGNITGGIGGGGGVGGYGGNAGEGGAGLTGSGFVLDNAGTVSGGQGGPASSDSYFAGHSSAGGAGVSGDTFSITNTGSIVGGAGGAGVQAYASAGNGGAGGAGVSGSGFSLDNAGSVAGGAGGAGYAGASSGGSPGTGAAGVAAFGNAMVINSGVIEGGLADGGSGAQADAVDFSGGGNTLELRAGYQFSGNVVSTSGTAQGGDTLALGGDVDGTFDLSQIVATQPGGYTGEVQYYGFAHYTKTGGSTWALAGTTDAAASWTVSAGALKLAAGASLGGVSGTLTVDGGTLDLNGTDQTVGALSGTGGQIVLGSGSLTIDQDSNTAYAGAISGSGSLTKSGTGTLILEGANTYAGGTTIGAGTLQIGNGGTAGSIVGDVTANGTLAFDRSDTVTFGDAISGSGGLVQQGTGTLILNGASTYTGMTTVASGLLEVGDANHPKAALAGDVLVQAGGTLRGHGSIGGGVEVAGGTVMPGGSTGILTVAGDYAQAAEGTLAIEITPDPTPGTGYSQLQVGGAAQLDGTLAIQVDPGTYLREAGYELVHAAGGVNGTFATTDFAPGFATYLTPEITYTANDVTLAFTPTPAAYSSGFPSYASTVNLGLEQTFDAVLGRPGPALEGRLGAWGQYLAGWGGLGQGERYAIQGGAAGVGVPVGDRFVLGAAVSGGTTTTTLSPTQVRAKPLGAFVYGVWREGGWRVAGSFGTGRLSQHTRRYLGEVGAVQEARSHGRYTGVALRGDYTASFGWLQVSPFVGMDAMNAHYGAAQEQGMPLLALHYGKASQHVSHYQAGLRLSGAGSKWQPWVQVNAEGWGGDRAVTVSETLGDFQQQVSSSPLPSGALGAGAGVNWHAGAWDAALSWHGAWGSRYHGNSGMLQVRYRW